MPLMPLALVAFFAFGVLLVLPGALQPALAEALGLDMAESARLASALSLGIGVGVLAIGPLADRWPRRWLFAASTALAAALLGAASLATAYSALLGALALLGFAAGCYETLLNAAVPESRPERAAGRLAAVHAAATLGAAIGAPLLGAGAATFGWSVACAWLAAALLALAALGAGARFPAPLPRTAHGMSSPLPARALAPLAAASFAYVGLETALTVLLPPFADSMQLDASRGVNAISGLWIGLMLARVVYARVARSARPREVALGALAAALLLAAGAVFAPRWLELWSAAIGLALGVVFPVLVVLAGDAAPARRASALGWVVAAGSVGGVALPWVAGEAGNALGAPPAIAVLALASTAIAAAAALARGNPLRFEDR